MLKVPKLIKRFCDALLEYDAETKQLYWYHNDRAPELCNKWISYEYCYELYKERYVCSDDLEVWDYFMMPENMERFARGETSESHFFIRFKNLGENKNMEWHEIFMEKMDDSSVLIGSRDIREVHRSAAIARAVLPEFDYVCFIDIETKSYVLYYPGSNQTVFSQNTSDDYHKVMEMVNKTYVVPEESETLTKHMQIEHVMQELENKDDYILYATVKGKEENSYKKLYFSYADETRRKLLLIRTDISDVVRERKLREYEEKKRMAYLDNMPVACVSAKVLLDEEERPYDFRITYANQAYAKLMGVNQDELFVNNFYEICPNTDRRRLQYYYETAYKGIPHIISWEIKERNKYALIHTFQTEVGHFGSVLVDITEEHFLTSELQKSREELQHVLKITTDLVFQYCPEKCEVHLTRVGKEELNRVIPENDLIRDMVDNHQLEKPYVQVIEEAFRRMREGENHLTVNIKACLETDRKWNWYRLTMFDFQTEYTHERKIFGYLQNIDQEMSKQEELKKRAQMDPLTKVMNAGEGKRKVQKRLEKQKEKPPLYNAMFLMDIDDFKRINDTYGHLVGDRVLEAFGKILKNTFCKEDVIYRLGGDEFVAFVENVDGSEKSIDSIMQRLQNQMEKVRAEYPFLSSSVGIYVTEDPCSFETYYIEADKALYETKKQRKSHYTVTRGKR